MFPMERDPDEYLRECVRIDDFDIQAEFIRLPADLAYWNEQYAQAYEAWQHAKLAMEKLQAELSIVIREELTSQNKGRVTLAEIDQVFHTTPQYHQARQLEIITESKKIKLYGVTSAIQAKKEMLISLGAHMRAEMANDPMVRNRMYVEGEVARNRGV